MRHNASVPSNRNDRDELILAGKQHLFPAVFHFFDRPLVIERAKDQYVWDSDGKQYLDFFGGIVTISVGHLNDRVNAAIHQQVDRLQHVSTLFPTRPQINLAAKLAKISPAGKLTKSFFTNSGSEANETAIQLARCYTGNTEIVALRHSYHGRTSGGRALTGQSVWRGPGPPDAGVVHAHNAYCYRCPFGKTYPSCDVACATDVKELIETSTSGSVAGFIAEPIQGIGGFITPPKEYFKIVTDIVREHGGIFICDEVQAACGRTGRWFGIENYDVVPDVVTLAKGLGNGLPIGATLARPEVADSMRFLTLSTFGGNPVTTAAAAAVVDFIAEQDLLTNSACAGAYLANQLAELQAEFPVIGDVRGVGLMQALELVCDRTTKEPATRQTDRLMEESRERGLLVGKGGLYGNVIRISPPLNISTADVDAFIAAFRPALCALPAC
ncbi:MAG: aspartate aminotransferase family protein [Acidobacteriia bacterium]|nr:aspartate aminotransferase family protein [Terriglobia bacterium]MYG04189.1 aspartate aminotransferase family protein [Terriglobia bacterium]MYK09524.1 aspartate aminotransferase family protein [Terriglobia bacterium]